MKENTKTILTGSLLLLIALLIVFLSIATTINGEVRIPSRGGVPAGWYFNVAQDGPWFYLVPAVQAIIGLLFLFGAVQTFAQRKAK